jgi:hypothetical protein
LASRGFVEVSGKAIKPRRFGVGGVCFVPRGGEGVDAIGQHVPGELIAWESVANGAGR